VTLLLIRFDKRVLLSPRLPMGFLLPARRLFASLGGSGLPGRLRLAAAGATGGRWLAPLICPQVAVLVFFAAAAPTRIIAPQRLAAARRLRLPAAVSAIGLHLPDRRRRAGDKLGVVDAVDHVVRDV
jgi:hypothetical protein